MRGHSVAEELAIPRSGYRTLLPVDVKLEPSLIPYLSHHPRQKNVVIELPDCPKLMGVKTRIDKDNHLFLQVLDHKMKSGIMDIGRATAPSKHQPEAVEHHAELAADNPPVIGDALPSDLLRAASLPHWLDGFDAEGIGQSDDRWISQETLGPVCLDRKEPKEPSAFREPWKERPVVSDEPPVEGSVASPFNLMVKRSPRVTVSLGLRLA